MLGARADLPRIIAQYAPHEVLVAVLNTKPSDLQGIVSALEPYRVPIKTLFEYLENNYSLEEFLECFPSVTGEMARRVLERSEAVLLAPA